MLSLRLVKHLSIPVLCLLCISQVAHAGKIYKWVDEHGVTHYSQTPPRQDHIVPETVQLEKFEAPSDQDNAALKTLAFAKELEISRLARENQRLERQLAMQQLALEEARLEAERAKNLIQRPGVFISHIKPRHHRKKRRHPHHEHFGISYKYNRQWQSGRSKANLKISGTSQHGR